MRNLALRRNFMTLCLHLNQLLPKGNKSIKIQKSFFCRNWIIKIFDLNILPFGFIFSWNFWLHLEDTKKSEFWQQIDELITLYKRNTFAEFCVEKKKGKNTAIVCSNNYVLFQNWFIQLLLKGNKSTFFVLVYSIVRI